MSSAGFLGSAFAPSVDWIILTAGLLVGNVNWFFLIIESILVVLHDYFGVCLCF